LPLAVHSLGTGTPPRRPPDQHAPHLATSSCAPVRRHRAHNRLRSACDAFASEAGALGSALFPALVAVQSS